MHSRAHLLVLLIIGIIAFLTTLVLFPSPTPTNLLIPQITLKNCVNTLTGYKEVLAQGVKNETKIAKIYVKALKKQGKIEKAKIAEAIYLKPETTLTRKENLKFSQAQNHNQKEEYQLAIKLLQPLHEKYRFHKEINVELARAYGLSGNLKKADALFELLPARFAKRYDNLSLYAKILKHNNAYERAAKKEYWLAKKTPQEIKKVKRIREVKKRTRRQIMISSQTKAQRQVIPSRQIDTSHFQQTRSTKIKLNKSFQFYLANHYFFTNRLFWEVRLLYKPFSSLSLIFDYKTIPILDNINTISNNLNAQKSTFRLELNDKKLNALMGVDFSLSALSDSNQLNSVGLDFLKGPLFLRFNKYDFLETRTTYFSPLSYHEAKALITLRQHKVYDLFYEIGLYSDMPLSHLIGIRYRFTPFERLKTILEVRKSLSSTHLLAETLLFQLEYKF